jgi:RHS repeat-associated protein
LGSAALRGKSPRRTWTLRDENLGDTYEYFADSQLQRYRHAVSRPDQNFNNPAGWTDTFAYDAAGNRTSLDENGTVTTYAADSLNRYTSVTGSTVAHDGRGNLTQWNGWTYAFDAENRLVTAAQAGVTLAFAYDPEGRLAKIDRNGVAEFRYYDGPQCFLRTDASGVQIDWTVWGPTPDEAVARQVPGGAWQYHHHDPLNGAVAVTNGAGAVLERYLYDPFGDPDVRDAAWAPRPGGTAIGNPWLFTGQEWRGEMGLMNYKARWHHPRLGRFLQTDPIRFDAGDLNLYRYCFNNPINYVDPEGQAVFLIPVAIYLGKMAAGYAVQKGLDYAQNNLVSEEYRDTVENIRTGVNFVRSITGDVKAIHSTARNLGAKAGQGTLNKVAPSATVAAENAGRTGKQARLRELGNDPNVSSADRGWIKQEQNAIERGQRDTIRNPPGKDLAHERGREAAKGYSYEHSNLQDRDLHRTQHKFDDIGRANKERPLRPDER